MSQQVNMKILLLTFLIVLPFVNGASFGVGENGLAVSGPQNTFALDDGEYVFEMSEDSLYNWPSYETESDSKGLNEIEKFDEELLEAEIRDSNPVSKSYAPWKVILLVVAAGVVLGLFIFVGVAVLIWIMSKRRAKAKQNEKEPPLEEVIVLDSNKKSVTG